jgi:bidirectional [NiFe] hydrogenase diaphorase subunit
MTTEKRPEGQAVAARPGPVSGIEDLEQLAEQELSRQKLCKNRLYVCMGTACQSCHSDKLLASLTAEVKARGLEDEYQVTPGGCQGNCAEAPLLTVQPEGNMYHYVAPEDAGAILDSLAGTETPERLKCDSQSRFFTGQKRVVTELRGLLNPEKIEEYIAVGGYAALLHALTQSTPEQVVQQIMKSGLRGRGGAGYPTGLKWGTVAKAEGAHKYVVCNADEGDPGAFMNRSVLEDYPYRVLEGMSIAAYAVGADQGFVYVRAEYPLAVKRVQNAIRMAQRHGLLGLNIGGTHFSFTIEVRLGAGAFVCGEETALIASIEGGRGTPRPRPPFPAAAGLWGFPTLINNVESYTNIVPILRNGPEWFSSIGTEKSKGTKTFALSGRVMNTGLIEVPLGTTLREIIFDIGGGVPEGHEFKAVQTGGPAGGCIPAKHLDMAVDYESLKSLGSFMGSGGMIVMDDTSCMVDIARFFMEFCMTESCGKCIPCRVGTAHLYELLGRITRGEGTLDTIKQLEDISDVVMNTSLCGLGQGAPNPILSTLRFFREEYMAHIVDKTCPAGVCTLGNHDTGR